MLDRSRRWRLNTGDEPTGSIAFKTPSAGAVEQRQPAPANSLARPCPAFSESMTPIVSRSGQPNHSVASSKFRRVSRQVATMLTRSALTRCPAGILRDVGVSCSNAAIRR